MTTYKIVRSFRDGHDDILIAEGLTLAEAKAHCHDPETHSKGCTSEEGLALTEAKGPWFDGYSEE